MTDANKDTIYIDIDDEITGIIDKVKGSDSKVVALVLPKRASVFQSIVNMKLLKRAADSANKNLVLITSESGLLPLAGAAGVYVAKSLNSKPEVPSGPEPEAPDEEIPEESFDSDDEANEEDAPVDKAKTVGVLAGVGAVGAAAAAAGKDEVETVELDNAEPTGDATKSAKPLKAPKKDKNLKVPDFDRFRLLLVGGVAAFILLLVGFFVLNRVLPSAKIIIKTDAKAVEVSSDLNLSTQATEVSTDTNTVPAKQVQTQKAYTQSAPATGQKNNGNKATGNVSFTAVMCGVASPGDIPAGTGVSSGGMTFITQQNTSFTFNKIQGGCIYFNSTSSTSVIAQNGGTNYNINNGKFSVAGRSDASGNGSTTGGTDNIVKVISQGDINAARAKIAPDENAIKQELKDQLKKQDLYAIEATYQAGAPKTTTSANVGDAADSVTVTDNVTYTMFGVKEDDLKEIIEQAVKEEVDTSKQSIIDYGFDSISFNASNISATGAQMTVSTTVAVGPELDKNQIKQDAAGKKPGEVEDEIETYPGVTEVEVKLSPFWVSSVPNNESKITVEIAKPEPNANN